MSSKHIVQTFGFDEVNKYDEAKCNGSAHTSHDIRSNPQFAPELKDIQKRIKRRHKQADFLWVSISEFAVRLSPKSLCYDARVTYLENAGYLVLNVSTCREKALPYEQDRHFNLAWNQKSFASVTVNPARVAKIINSTVSITQDTVLQSAMNKTLRRFEGGLVNAQEKLKKLTRRVFGRMPDSEKDGALLEYCLASMEGRAVVSSVVANAKERVTKYLTAKKDLGYSIDVCTGQAVLALYKFQDEHRIHYTYGDSGNRFKGYVPDVNELPKEVLSKLAVLQTTGTAGMDDLDQYYGTKVLDSVGCVYDTDRDDMAFIEDAMCVFVSPSTLQEVATLAN